MLKCVVRERWYHVENELRSNLKRYDEGYFKSQKLLETLQKEKESRLTKLDILKTKAKEFSAKEESLKLSLEDALCSKKKL